MDDIGEVISSSATVKKEVQTLEGRWYQMTALPYTKQQNNQNDGAIITFNDITELKESRDKLSRINADHDTFIYAVSHDLKGPLANLKSLASFLEDSVGLQTKEDKETLELIGQSISNLTETINELSDIAKIENEIEANENINVKQLIKEVESNMRDSLVKTKAAINLDLKVTEIPFSKKNLRGIITNLLSNSIKYSSPERTPEVTIKTEKSADFIKLSVRDNGLGIPENKKDEIFAKFKRAHTHVEGNGVGLYLVKKIITNAGGDIEVESELGKGTVFNVYFRNNPMAGEK